MVDDINQIYDITLLFNTSDFMSMMILNNVFDNFVLRKLNKANNTLVAIATNIYPYDGFANGQTGPSTQVF